MQKCSITASNGSLILKTPYEPRLVADLKASVPTTDRKFDPTQKAWIVSPSYGQTLVQLVTLYFNEMVQLPSVNVQTRKETRLLEVHYVGQCKIREDGSTSAFAYINGDWAAVFPEQTLRDWFEAGPAPVQAPDQAATLYAVLGVAKTASIDEIKSGFRKMARTWHPDVCKEPNAAEMFIRIKEAADILSDSRRRAKYDAGLALEASLTHRQPVRMLVDTGSYRPPLRCGWIMVEGKEVIGRFVVDKILAWEDIVMGNLVLVTSWPMGAKQPVESWV